MSVAPGVTIASTRRSSVPLRLRAISAREAQERAFGQAGGEAHRPVVDLGDRVELAAGGGGRCPRRCRAERALAPVGADRTPGLSPSPMPRTSRPPLPHHGLPKRAYCLLHSNGYSAPACATFRTGKQLRALSGETKWPSLGRPDNGPSLRLADRQPAAAPTRIRVRPSPPRGLMRSGHMVACGCGRFCGGIEEFFRQGRLQGAGPRRCSYRHLAAPSRRSRFSAPAAPQFARARTSAAPPWGRRRSRAGCGIGERLDMPACRRAQAARPGGGRCPQPTLPAWFAASERTRPR